jgi:uncharacterized protein (DUF433 family)
MSTINQYPHLAAGEDGVMRIGATRYKVIHLAAEHYHYGWSAEELLRQHPDLRPEEVYAALTYFYDHYDELVNEIKSTAERVPDAAFTQPLRAELLRRRKSASP